MRVSAASRLQDRERRTLVLGITVQNRLHCGSVRLVALCLDRRTLYAPKLSLNPVRTWITTLPSPLPCALSPTAMSSICAAVPSPRMNLRSRKTVPSARIWSDALSSSTIG